VPVTDDQELAQLWPGGAVHCEDHSVMEKLVHFASSRDASNGLELATLAFLTRPLLFLRSRLRSWARLEVENGRLEARCRS
jgi:hypothetical protein